MSNWPGPDPPLPHDVSSVHSVVVVVVVPMVLVVWPPVVVQVPVTLVVVLETVDVAGVVVVVVVEPKAAHVGGAEQLRATNAFGESSEGAVHVEQKRSPPIVSTSETIPCCGSSSAM